MRDRPEGLPGNLRQRLEQIRAHVQLCRLALLLIRVVENDTGDTWRTTRHELDRMHLVTLAIGAGCSNTTPTGPAAPFRRSHAGNWPPVRL